jgi:hypothetical protein
MIFRVFFINNEDYPNANEVSLAISVEKMPQSLLTNPREPNSWYNCTANPRWKGVKVCLESETIDSVIPRIFLILSIGTVYGSGFLCFLFRGETVPYKCCFERGRQHQRGRLCPRWHCSCLSRWMSHTLVPLALRTVGMTFVKKHH